MQSVRGAFARITTLVVICGLLLPMGTMRSTLRGQAPAGGNIVRAIVFDAVRVKLDALDGNEETFASVQRVFGVAVPMLGGHHEIDQLCYRLTIAGKPATLLFKSDEFGGTDHGILGFEIIAGDPPATIAPMCARATYSPRKVSTDNGLSLGMSFDSLMRIMGKPTSVKSGEYRFEYEPSRAQVLAICKEPPETCDVTGDLVATVSAAKVVGLSGWLLMTN